MLGMSGRTKKSGWNRSKKASDSDAGNGSLPVEAGKYGEMFRACKQELDASQDKRERLVKLSRDCTIHSKRAIFTLHRFSGEEDTKSKVLEEADAKFTEDVLPVLHSICEEIGTEDPYTYHRAYSPGVQEFIEAMAFYKYLKSGRLISFKEAQDILTFKEKCNAEETEKSDLPKELTAKEEGSCDGVLVASSSTSEGNGVKSVLYLTPSDYVLGLADLTGELMRLCINAVGSGNRELPFTLLPFFRALFCGFHSFGSGVRYMNQKMTVLRSSLGKVENVCYTLKVRGSEIPKQMLMDVINTTEPDENFT